MLLSRPLPAVCEAKCTAGLSARSHVAVRAPLCTAPSRLGSWRPRCVEVFADKGKRRGRSMNPGEQLQRQMPQMNMPEVDPENTQFVIYVRSKFGLKKWMPLNVLTGGSQANLLAKGLDSDLTKEASMSTLKREFAKTIYKDKAQVEEMCRTKMGPTLKFAKELEYGMAILNKEKPKESIMGIGTTIWALPAEAEIEKTAAEQVQEGAAGVLDSISSGWSSFVDGLANPGGVGKATA